MEKAYDRMSWRFADLVLSRFMFNQQFVWWLMGCIRGSLLYSLNSWISDGVVFIYYGLHQDCPYHRIYLFLHQKSYLGLWKGAKYQNTCGSRHRWCRQLIDTPLICIWLFYLVQTTLQEAKNLKQVLSICVEVSGQTININKSAIYFQKDVDSRIRRRVSRFLSIHSSTMSFKCLGVFVGGRRVLMSYFNGSISEVRSKLSGWKYELLSLVARKV